MKCTYCGGESELNREHVIPASYLGRKTFHRNSQWLVDSCKTCNTRAGTEVFFSIPEKANYIKREYQRKYAKILRLPEWATDELDELSMDLKKLVLAGLSEKRDFLRRIEHLAYIATLNNDYLMPDWFKDNV